MAKAPAKKTPAPQKTDVDAGIKNQLAPYGLTIEDVIAVLEEDPKNLQYVEAGKNGKTLASTVMKHQYSHHQARHGGKTGYCGEGVYCIVSEASKSGGVCKINGGGGREIATKCEQSKGYFNVSYHAQETDAVFACSPEGTIFTWGSDDVASKRVGSGGPNWGHTVVKGNDTYGGCDFLSSRDKITNLVLHGGAGGGPRYGTVMDISIAKDCTFSPVLLERAAAKKKEREQQSQYPTPIVVKEPTALEARNFLGQNPRIAYLLLKKFDPNLPNNLRGSDINCGTPGIEMINYYNKLPKNDPKRVALDMLITKKMKNLKDYASVNKAIDEIYLEVSKASNPKAYERLRKPSADELSNLTIRTPGYAEMLLKKMNVKHPDISTSDKLDKYMKDLAAKKTKGTLNRDEGSAYEALCALAKKGLTPNDGKDKVNHEIAAITKTYRTATKDEVSALFDNTPFYATLLQRELGITKYGDHEFTTDEFNRYYKGETIDGKKITPAEKKAIESLAMEGLTKNSGNVLDVIRDVAEQYKDPKQKDLVASVDKTADEKNKISTTQAMLRGRDVC